MWCDTKFTGGEKLTISEIVHRLINAWGSTPPEEWRRELRPMVVITGGEPTLQLDIPLVREIKRAGFFIAVETNGTNTVPSLEYVDHVTVSPKKRSELTLRWGSELKVVLPGRVPTAHVSHGWSEDDLLELAATGRWGALYVQPQDVTDQTTVEVSALSIRRTKGMHVLGAEYAENQFQANVETCLAFISRNPEWKLSLQTHKFIGIR
jgi:organic radical activating enzyme